MLYTQPCRACLSWKSARTARHEPARRGAPSPSAPAPGCAHAGRGTGQFRWGEPFVTSGNGDGASVDGYILSAVQNSNNGFAVGGSVRGGLDTLAGSTMPAGHAWFLATLVACRGNCEHREPCAVGRPTTCGPCTADYVDRAGACVPDEDSSVWARYSGTFTRIAMGVFISLAVVAAIYVVVVLRRGRQRTASPHSRRLGHARYERVVWAAARGALWRPVRRRLTRTAPCARGRAKSQTDARDSMELLEIRPRAEHASAAGGGNEDADGDDEDVLFDMTK